MAALQPWPPLYMQSQILKAFVRQQQDQVEEFRRIEEHLRMLLMLATRAKQYTSCLPPSNFKNVLEKLLTEMRDILTVQLNHVQRHRADLAQKNQHVVYWLQFCYPAAVLQ